MTNAPIYKSQIGDRPVGQTSLRNYDTKESFGSEVGDAMKSVGAAALEVRSALQLRDELAGETRVREGRERLRENTRTAVGDAANATGLNAKVAGEKALERLERMRQEEAAKFTNPREREKFLQDTEALAMSRADDIYKNMTAQEKQATIDGYQAGVTGYQEDALDHFNDDAKFEEDLASAVAEQERLGALTGVAPETMERANEALVMETLSQRAVLMAASDPEAAAQYIENEERLSATEKQKVKDLLAPAVQGARVESWMSQFIKTGSGGSSGSFLETTMTRESGGNPNAQNALSSAGGLFQYTDGTWKQSVAAASASGALPPEFAGMSQSELVAAKMNPDLQMAVMKYDEVRYEQLIEATGAPINNVNKYLLHHFGMGAGPAILRELQANPGASVASVYKAIGADWSGVVSANPGVSYNMTVSELHAYAGRHIGEGGATVEFDFGAAYSFAQTIADPKDRAAFLAQVEQREATEAARKRATSGAVIDDASERYFTTGDSTLTLQEQIALGIDGTNVFREMVSRNETGKLVTDPEVYGMLRDMQLSQDLATRKDFAAEGSIEMYRDRLSAADYRALSDARSAARGELEGIAITEDQIAKNPALAVPVKSEDRTAIGRHLDRVGVKGGEKNAQERAKAEYQMELRLQQQKIDFWNENKREPTTPEIDDMIYAQTLNITPDTMFGGPKMLFQYSDLQDGETPKPFIEYDDVPAEARAELTRKLSVALGRTPTPEEVAQAFVNRTLIRGQEAPVPLDSMELPVAAFVYGNMMGMSEDELRMHWETYVNDVAAGLINPEEEPFASLPTIRPQ
jgi:hypothetical protein